MIGRLKCVAASDLLLRRTAFSESIRRHVESFSDSLQRISIFANINNNKRHERNNFKYSRRNEDPKLF